MILQLKAAGSFSKGYGSSISVLVLGSCPISHETYLKLRRNVDKMTIIFTKNDNFDNSQ